VFQSRAEAHVAACRSDDEGSASEASGCCARGAVAKGDRGDHVWLLRVLAQQGGMRFDGSSFFAPMPTRMGHCALGALLVESPAMGLLTFGLNVTLDGCIDHTQGIADDELHDYWTQLMDQSGAMLFGRNTYELMEGAWPAVARDENAPRAMREWAQKLDAKAKYVVSGSRSDFPWRNTFKVEGVLREAISELKAKTERGVLVGAPKLAAALEELALIDEYRIVVHPVISGRGPTLFHGLSSARHLELLSTQGFKSGVQALHFRRKAG
jgi:dihydrofolate reductase